MRKTLAVLVLMISSMLLLQAPSWAPPPDNHLYKINTGGSFVALTDCTGTVMIRPNPDADVVTVKHPEKKKQMFGTIIAEKYIFNTNDPFSPSSLRARCDGKLMKISPNVLGVDVPLARTGRPVVPQLLLGIGLLLIGSLFVALTVHPSLAAGLRRRRPRPTTPS